jgi:hypothetical protein
MKYKAYNSFNFNEIPRIRNVSESLRKEILISSRVLPFKTNNYVTDF